MSVNRAEKKSIDKFIPWMIVLFFVVFVSVDMVFLTIAVRTNTGSVSENAYEDGLHYNRALDAVERQNSEGWSHLFSFQDGVLRVQMKNNLSSNVPGAKVKAVFTRPVHAGEDFELVLDETDTGVYETRPEIPLPGQWNVRIYAEWQGNPYQFSQTITAP